VILRGEVWRVLVLGRSERTVVVVGHDRVTAGRPDVLCVQVDTSGTFGADLVTVELAGIGAARAVTVGPLSKTSFAERLDAVDPATLEQLDIALRATLDL
jgi:mRNA-degrading endonuclease toxin of MazEF toxin-antitoxin module